jgi:hypothetical protein
MKLVLNIAGGILILAGTIFVLQGSGLLMGSPMTGQTQWVINGSVSFVLGVMLIGWNYRRRAN